MENEILQILNNIINEIDEKKITKQERQAIKYKENKNNSISFLAYNNIILKITIQKSNKFIEIRKLDNIDLDLLKSKFKKVLYKDEELYIKLYIEEIEEINKIKDELIEIYTYLHFNETVDTFGCCSRYEECSNKKECINPDKKLARGCQYKVNLENGRIFYGINKNIK